MKQKKTLLTIGIITLILGVIVFIRSFSRGDRFAATVMYSLLLISGGIVMLVIYKKQVTKQELRRVDESQQNYNLLERVQLGWYLAYSYENNICFIEGKFSASGVSGNGGKPIKFTAENDNQCDDKAMLIMLNGNPVGYVYSGKTRDMLYDWIRGKLYFEAYINKIDVANNTATFKVGFYKSLDNCDHKTYSVTKTAQKDDSGVKRSENLALCDVGDEVDISDGYGGYTLSDLCSDIGELPPAAATFIGDTDLDKLAVVITSMEYDDNDQPEAEVTIYKIP